jgi:hypothetical protein
MPLGRCQPASQATARSARTALQPFGDWIIDDDEHLEFIHTTQAVDWVIR